jgi:predicted  nucleic acid-binding Zn-ribbon protein
MAEQNRDQIILQELVRRSNDETRRIRELEKRFQMLEEKTSSLEGTILEKTNKIDSKFIEMEADVKNIGDELLRIKNNLEKINKQMGRFALKRDIKEIERMFDLLNPVKEKSGLQELTVE